MSEIFGGGGGGSNHNILSATHTDSLASSVVRGDLIVGNATPKWARLALGTANYRLQSGATDPSWVVTDIGCRVFNSIAQTLTNATLTAITFDSERYDTDTMHSTTVNTSRITFTTAGKYLVVGDLDFSSNQTDKRILSIRLNGVTEIANVQNSAMAVAGRTSMIVSTVYNFAANDYVELMARQDSGGNLDTQVNANSSPEFMAQKIDRGG